MSKIVNTLLEKHLFGANTKEGLEKLIMEKTEQLMHIEKDIASLRKNLTAKPKQVVRYT